MLRIIGIGLDDGEITEKGLEGLEHSEKAFAEFYTNTETIDLEALETRAETPIEKLDRDQVEKKDRIIEEAEDSDIAFLVSGDPLAATTHYDIKYRAEKKKIETRVIHAPSILTSVSDTGLNIYKFGRVVTLPEDSKPESILNYIQKNDSIGLHTLVLLDIDYNADDAAEKLQNMGVEDRESVVIERANMESQEISVMSLEEISRSDFGEPPHSLVLTGEKSHKEEDFLDQHNE